MLYNFSLEFYLGKKSTIKSARQITVIIQLTFMDKT